MLKTVCAVPVDWSATGDMLSGIGTIAGAAFVLIAARIGRNTFEGWKRQRIEERRSNLAEQVLTLAYRLQEALSVIRSPLRLLGESQESEKKLREQDMIKSSTSDRQIQMLLTAQSSLTRISDFADAFDQLANVRPLMRAIFGQPLTAHLETIVTARNKVRGAAHSYAAAARPMRAHPMINEVEYAEQRVFEDILWEGAAFDLTTGEEDDRIKRDVDAAVAALETAFRPYFDLTATA
ncbi:hypothetical protein [Sphingomonas faeni]|uniref:hypothetical protein n=1 Tax=Sphingomonas faeni TaxID=185950 RepID=UPI00241344F2|nr:hypothetical protein [Sphingomonas faeni]